MADNKKKKPDESGKTDPMDVLDKTWIAKQIGMSRANLYHSLRYGFTKPQARKVRDLFQDLGLQCINYRVPVRVIRAYTEFYDGDDDA